jgi:hypothetical protein
MKWLNRWGWLRRRSDREIAVEDEAPRSMSAEMESDAARAEDLAAGLDPGADSELEDLLARARALSRERTPERDLWSGIENRIENRIESRDRALERSPWSLTSLFPRPVVAMAMAVMLVSTTALSVLWWTQQGGRNLDGANPFGAPRTDTQMAAIAQDLRERDGVADVHASIRELLDAHRTELPPETLAILDENLRSIDRAIAEISLALEANPDHHALGFLLAEAYRSEAELLERLEWWLQTPPEATS